MGTSNAYGGAGGGTPLIPSWLQGGGDAPASPPPDGAAPPTAVPGAPPPAVPAVPVAKPPIPAAGASDR